MKYLEFNLEHALKMYQPIWTIFLKDSYLVSNQCEDYRLTVSQIDFFRLDVERILDQAITFVIIGQIVNFGNLVTRKKMKISKKKAQKHKYMVDLHKWPPNERQKSTESSSYRKIERKVQQIWVKQVEYLFYAWRISIHSVCLTVFLNL